MPAAAVIPAPIAYIKVVAVKKLVVEFLAGAVLALSRCSTWSSVWEASTSFSGRLVDHTLYFEKIRVFQAGNCLDTSAWNNGLGL